MTCEEMPQLESVLYSYIIYILYLVYNGNARKEENNLISVNAKNDSKMYPVILRMLQ